MKYNILVVDDDPGLADILKKVLQSDGYRVLWAQDGFQALYLLDECPDLILLDLMLPRMDGWEVCQQVRARSDVPILMLTAISGESNVLRGLDLGADGYIVKPFSIRELQARIQATLRRAKAPLSGIRVIEIDDRLAVDPTTCSLIVDGKAVELSPTEYKLLEYFVQNPGRVLTHYALLTHIWGWEYSEETHYLKVYVYKLRNKMEKDPRSPRYIITERGMGYRFQSSLL